MTTTFQEELSKFHEDGEKRFAQSVLHQVPYVSAWSEPTVFYPRFEKAIASLKPTKLKADPATHFWTVYKKVADEHDDDLVSKYAGDLDTSLLFVSAFTSLHVLFGSTGPYCVRPVCFRLSPPLSLSKSFLNSTWIPPMSQTTSSSEY